MANDNDELIGAIRSAIAPMWRDTQDRVSNLRDGLRHDIQTSQQGLEAKIDAKVDRLQSQIGTVESRLGELVASVEKL
jgi:hypothetical protein